MVSAWGGYVFIINLIPLHVFVLLLMGHFSHKIYIGKNCHQIHTCSFGLLFSKYSFIAYNTFFVLGLLLSMQIPFVGFQPIRSSEHMASIGVFLLLNAYALLNYFYSLVSKSEFKLLFFTSTAGFAGLVFLGIVLLTYGGYIAPWSGRFYSLWDTEYAKIHIPIIASVSEHQPTTWFAFFFDLHLLIPTYPIGLWYCIKQINEERTFSKF